MRGAMRRRRKARRRIDGRSRIAIGRGSECVGRRSESTRFKPNRDVSQPDSATSLKFRSQLRNLASEKCSPRQADGRVAPQGGGFRSRARHGVLQGRALKRAILFTRRLLATVAIRGCIARGTAAAIRDESRDGATASPSAADTVAGLGAVE